MSENKKPKLNIEVDKDVADGQYSNLAIINHSMSEFVVDFVNVMPGNPVNKVKSRIILTPQHAKRLVNALVDNLNKFEKAHGKIVEPNNSAIPLSFGPTGQA